MFQRKALLSLSVSKIKGEIKYTRCDQCTSSLVVSCAQFSGKKTKRPLYPSHPTVQIWLLLPKLKSTLKGRRFNIIDEIQKNSTKDFFAIPKEALQKAFQSWQKRWELCVASEGNYFEGNKLECVVSINIVKLSLQQSGLLLIIPCICITIKHIHAYYLYINLRLHCVTIHTTQNEHSQP